MNIFKKARAYALSTIIGLMALKSEKAEAQTNRVGPYFASTAKTDGRFTGRYVVGSTMNTEDQSLRLDGRLMLAFNALNINDKAFVSLQSAYGRFVDLNTGEHTGYVGGNASLYVPFNQKAGFYFVYAPDIDLKNPAFFTGISFLLNGKKEDRKMNNAVWLEGQRFN